MPTGEELSAMMQYNEELAGAGILAAGDGLHPTSKGARIEFPTGEPVVTDGPFTESKEVLGGCWIWKVGSKAEALEWASKCPMTEGDVLELRQIFEAEDYGPEVAGQGRELLERIGSQSS